MSEAWLPDDCGTDPHVVVAMSGGVDSSVAALRVHRSGIRCSALFMKNWNEPADAGTCQWEDDVADALQVCEKLGIEINTVDLSADYWEHVFEDFLAEYQRGRTPNPDILCNREIKFRSFLDCAREQGADLIATGHYVQRGRADGLDTLEKGADPGKDQSYFLYTLGQAQLASSLFPIGDMPKRRVRELAREAGLSTHEKKDSTGICFIGEQHFRSFLSRFVPARPGEIVDLAGRTVGEHAGAVFYTLGQRQGLGIGGVSGASEAPWFVVAKDLPRNRLTVAQGHDHPALLSTHLLASDLSWVSGLPPAAPFRCVARTRYRQSEQPCTIQAINNGTVSVRFESPQRAVTPGQSVVFYSGARCLGGGIIDSTS